MQNKFNKTTTTNVSFMTWYLHGLVYELYPKCNVIPIIHLKYLYIWIHFGFMIIIFIIQCIFFIYLARVAPRFQRKWDKDKLNNCISSTTNQNMLLSEVILLVPHEHVIKHQSTIIIYYLFTHFLLISLDVCFRDVHVNNW